VIHLDLVNYNTELRIIRTENATAVNIPLPQSLTTGGVGLPGVAQLVEKMNAALELLGLKFTDEPPSNTVIPEGEDA
jgi:hypothetical protein